MGLGSRENYQMSCIMTRYDKVIWSWSKLNKFCPNLALKLSLVVDSKVEFSQQELFSLPVVPWQCFWPVFEAPSAATRVFGHLFWSQPLTWSVLRTPEIWNSRSDTPARDWKCCDVIVENHPHLDQCWRPLVPSWVPWAQQLPSLISPYVELPSMPSSRVIVQCCRKHCSPFWCRACCATASSKWDRSFCSSTTQWT